MSKHEINFRYDRYILPNGRRVFLSNRPDVVIESQVLEFIKKETPVVRYQFTDNWVDFNYGPPKEWFLWVPGKNPTIESVYSFLHSMNNFDSKEGLDKSIWLHCDSSSMRAPTFFGLYLSTYYPNEMKSIVDAAMPLKNMSRPDEYVETEFKLDKEVKTLVELLKKSEADAYKFLVRRK
jgi:hypothetical protein